MDILYVIKKDPDKTLNTIIEEQKKTHDVEVIDIRTNSDYATILDRIAEADRVTSW